VAEGLEFITDNTNFQPSLTLRNSVRAAISALDSNGPSSLESLGRGVSMVLRAKELSRHSLGQENTSSLLHRWVKDCSYQARCQEEEGVAMARLGDYY